LNQTCDNLESADAVTITLEFQKRDERDDPVTQSRTNHPQFCPVKAAAKLVKYLRSVGGHDDTFIYFYQNPGSQQLEPLMGPQCLKFLRSFIDEIDHESRGLTKSTQVGLHSLRSSAAMAMHLNGVPTATLMLQGRWSSDAYLRYLRKQVAEFGQDVADRMLQTPAFHHVPEPDPSDPRTHNPQSEAANRGMGRSGRSIRKSKFALYG
jgi:hypothetical protein